MTTQTNNSGKMRRFLTTIIYWFACLFGIGQWVCIEAQIASPIITQADKWQWAWLSDARLPLLSQAALPLLAGVIVMATFMLMLAALRLVQKNKIPNAKTHLFTKLSRLRFYGAMFFCAWALCRLAPFVTHDCQWGPALRAALIAAGRIMTLAMIWDALNIHELISNISAFCANKERYYFGAGAALIIAVIACTNIKLTGDEPSYVFMAGSIRNDQNLLVDAGETFLLNQLAQMPQTHRAHQVNIKGADNIEREVPWHFAGPAIVILPAWFVSEWTGTPLAPTMRFYMLAMFLLWMYGSYWLTKRLTSWPMVAIISTFIVAISCPMLGLSKSIFPDNITGYLLLAALCIAANIFAGKTKRLTLQQASGIIAIACVIPWMHYKYALLSIVLGGFVIVYRPRLSAKNIATLLVILAAGIAAFAAYYYKTYGLNLIGEPSEAPTGSGYFGLFFDNDSGLIPYAPWLILIPAGIIALARKRNTYSYGITWTLLFLAVYLPTANTPFWGSPGSPVLRYLSPAIACAAPLLASAITSLRYRAFAIFILMLIPAAAAVTYIHSNWQVYGATLQTGRTLLDNTIDTFAWNEFFPYYIFSMRTLNKTGNTTQTILIILIIIAMLRGLNKFRNNRRKCAAILMMTPLLLATAARLSSAPNYGMNAIKLFTQQTHQIAKVQNKTPHKNITTAAYLPLTTKPFNTEGYRTLAPNNALDLDQRRPQSNFATLATPYELSAGRYTFTLYGIATADNPTTAHLSMKIQQLPTAKVLANIQTQPLPQKDPQLFATQTDTALLTSTLTLDTNARLRIVLQSTEGPCVYATRFKIQYHGISQ